MAILDLDAVRLELPGYAEPLKELVKSLDIENKKHRVQELEMLMQEPGFWDDTEKAQKLMQESNSKKADIEVCERLEKQYEDFPDLISMAEEEGAYVLSDKATFLTFRANDGELEEAA